MFTGFSASSQLTLELVIALTVFHRGDQNRRKTPAHRSSSLPYRKKLSFSLEDSPGE
jgi:hypothetical protein